MMSLDEPAPGTAPRATEPGLHSVLFMSPVAGPAARPAEQPDYFVDLNLDQVVASLTAGRDQYHLEAFFFATLRQEAAVRYRHDVLRDLEQPAVRSAITEFAGRMQRVREQLEQAAKLRYPLQSQAWFVEAVETYCAAVRALSGALAACDLPSRGLSGLRDFLAGYTASSRFTSMTREIGELKDALRQVRYAVRTNGDRVTVLRYTGEPDYCAEVAATFAKFQQGAVSSYLANLRDDPEMNPVEAQILDRVARLYPEVFVARTAFCASHRDFVEPTVGRFDREIQFYLAYLELVDRGRAAGLPFCYPQVSARSKEIAVAQGFDIALANKLLAGEGTVVGNDFHLTGPERMFVVTGPNNGGKTTFARMFGQLHHLAGLGLLVPGREARLFLPDRIFTHFERAEDIETRRGKFDDELVRVHDILEQASTNSVIVMNESFSSTSLNDALYVGTEVLRQILELRCLGVYVTFVDEIASLSGATVSMVGQVEPADAAMRTFKLLRTPADGRAHAWAIAEKYGLSYQRLIERIGR